MKSTILLAVGLAFIGGSLYLFVQNPANLPNRPGKEIQEMPKVSLVIRETTILAEVVDTSESRMRGLSGRESLPWGEGMFFVFDKPDFYSFWMKDMNFAIDIAWLNEERQIVHIERGVGPETYPKSFTPPLPASFVLEVPAGFFEEIGATIGDTVLTLN